MELINKKVVIIDYYKSSNMPVHAFYQHDNNQLEFVIEENGTAADLSNVSRVLVNIKRPDGKVVSRELDRDENVILYKMQHEEMKVSGHAALTLQFYNEDGDRLSTAKITIYIASTVEANVEFKDKQGTLYQQIIMEIDGLKDQLYTLNKLTEEKGEAAESKGEFAEEKAQEAIAAAELAAEEAANLSQLKTDVTGATEAASTAAETARTNADHAKTQGDYAKEQADIAAQRTEELNGLEVSQFYDRQEEFSRQLADNVHYSNPKITNINEKKSNFPIVSFIDDDGVIDVYTRLYPVFKSKNVPFGSAIITGSVGKSGFMSLSQVKECNQNGMEILSHTVTHKNLALDGLSADQIDSELRDSKKWLIENGLENESFVYPQSGHNLSIRKNMRMYYNYAFGDNGFNDDGYLDHSRIKRIAFGSWTGDNPVINGNSEKTTLAYYKAAVDYAVSKNIWLVFMIHVGQHSSEQDDILGQLIDYIKSVNVQILKPSDAFKIKGNKFSFGEKEENHLWIGEKEIHGNSVTTWEPYNGRVASTPITQYVSGRVTLIQYVSTFNAGFPEASGICETYRSDLNEMLSHQVFYSSSGLVFKRTWNSSSNTWNRFEVQNSKILTMNSMTNDKIPVAFPPSISYCMIQTASANGFPHNIGGTLMTSRIIQSSGYDFQTYKPFGKNETWTRYAIDNNNWSSWSLDSVPDGYEVFTIQMTQQVIPANTAVDVILTHASVKTSDFITGNPVSGLTTGLMYSIMCLENGKITVRVFNASGSEKTITARPWKFQKTN